MFSKLYLKFFFLFLIFGFFIISAIYFVNKQVLKSNLDDIKSNYSSTYFKIQAYYMKNSLEEAKLNINSIISNKLFLNYLENGSYDKIQEIFYSFILAKKEIFQIRFLDTDGKEKVRLQQYGSEKEPIIIAENKLQNKKSHSYFINTINDINNDFHFSDFNLNMENGEIEIPYQPTIRVSKSVYTNDKNMAGIIVVNIDMNKFVNMFKSFDKFNTYLIDKDGNFLLHINKEKEWSNVLKVKYNIKDEIKDNNVLNAIFNSENYYSDFLYSYSLDNILNNNQGLKIVYIPNTSYINKILSDSNFKLLVVVIPFMVILGLVLAIYPTKIREELIILLEKNSKNLKLINQNVAISLTDEKGKILEVNDAFCELTSYSKEELIGNYHTILKSGNIDENRYIELWETINSGKIWIGELENIKKNGQTYWVELRIEPRFNETTQKTEFLSIVRNITDKKLMEVIAQTDPLTNLFNRVKLDEELKIELYNVQRYNTEVSVMILDIDYFKKVNDKYGHNVGDTVLIEFANILKSSVRKSDIVGRWGGEEFLIISPETKKDDMIKLALKIKDSVEAYNFSIVGHKTASIGVTQIKKEDSSPKTFIQRADEALYVAKANGRNKVECDESTLKKVVENNYII